jgi:hypothetical protein
VIRITGHEQSSKFKPAVNLKTAKALLTVPLAIMLRGRRDDRMRVDDLRLWHIASYATLQVSTFPQNLDSDMLIA